VVVKINAQKRRHKLLKILEAAKEPIIGSELAATFSVSRQVIVQDIALLRAKGENILATSQGYILSDNVGMEMFRTKIACKHSGDEDVEDELMTIINHGAKIIDVIVEHPLYGELCGLLMIKSAEDVRNFMKKYRQEEASLLAVLTDGVHLHTVEAMNKEVIKRLKKSLSKKGYLLDNK